MRAITFSSHGSADVYEYSTLVEKPEPGTDEVLVRVRYAALNRLDDFVRQGWPGLDLVWPHIPGSDMSGEIAELGQGVSGWKVGQRVVVDPMLSCGTCSACLAGYQNRCRDGVILGEHRPGACAEFVVVPAVNLLAVPEGYEMTLAAAAPLVYSTAWHSLIRAGSLRAGERVLIVGAGGGVNSASLQIAKLSGAQVWVIAGDEAKARRATELGADRVWDRSQDPECSRAVYLASGREGVDMVVDNVGEATWGASLRTLSVGGRLVTVGGTSGYQARVPVSLIFGRQLRIIGSTMGSRSDFKRVMSLVFRGRLTPEIDSVYPLSRYPEALSHMVAGAHFGKILIDVAGGETDGSDRADAR